MASDSPRGATGTMRIPAPPPDRLDVRGAFREGWWAFRRAPWVFVGFTLLMTALTSILTLIHSNLVEAGLNPLTWLIAQLAQLGSTLVGLWGGVGMIRGAMLALAGQRPRFSDLTHIDARAILRVLLSNLLFTLLLSVVLVPLLIATAAGFFQMVELEFPVFGLPIVRGFNPTPGLLTLTVLPLLSGLGLMTYLVVNQHFLMQLASVGRRGPWRTLTEGRAVVDRQWGPTLLLILLESLLLLAGLAALLVGVFVAIPAITCISTAAYRQLFKNPEGTAGPPVA
jgi:hypothetical protein